MNNILSLVEKIIAELVFTLSKGGENIGTKFPVETNITKQAAQQEI